MIHGDAANYSKTFKEVLNGADILTVIQERKEKDKPFAVLDLMGYGSVIRDISGKLKDEHIKGLSVALSDIRSEEQKVSDDTVDALVADITKSETWDKIDVWLSNKGVEGFDMVLCRPMGGLDDIPSSLKFYAILLNKMWHSLDSKSGMILTEVPKDVEVQTLEMLKENLLKQGITSSTGKNQLLEKYPVLRIDRNSKNGESLEFPQE